MRKTTPASSVPPQVKLLVLAKIVPILVAEMICSICESYWVEL